MAGTMADASQQDWVKRVLGIAIAGAPNTSAPNTGAPQSKGGGKLMPIWLDAKEAVDAGIGKLQDALRNADDEDLQQIAEFGLYGATQGETVRLMAALRDADGGGAEALPKLLDAVHDYRDFLEGAPIVDLIEDNPFGVAVPLRKTLGAALAELERRAAA
jgi:hypothetical protein